MAANNSNTLVDQKLAVSLFLESLLREPRAPEIEEPVQSPEPQVAESQIPEPQVEVQPVAPPPAAPDTLSTTHARADIGAAPQAEPIARTEESEIFQPAWAKEPFQVLLFEVAGLTLAVPLVELSGVVEWKNDVTEMPGHADFYMGILQHLDKKIPVIDTARMVLPPDRLAKLVGDRPHDRVSHVVFIDEYRWGLACDAVKEVITLKPEEVRWRSSKSKRSWLAGTVIEHMCALLNSAGFSEMLKIGKDKYLSENSR